MAIQSNFPAIRPSLLLDFANSKRLDPRITFTRASTARYYDGSTVAKAEENLFQQSQAFGDGYWSKTDITVTADSTAAPDGTTTADTITEGTATTAQVQRTLTITSGAIVTASVFVKPSANNDWVLLTLSSAANFVRGWFNISTGTAGSTTVGGTGANAAISMVASANGFYRCILSGSFAGATSYVVTIGSASADTSVTRVNNATYFLWGAQLEERSSVTAYTATTTAPITNYVPQLLTAQNGVPRFDNNPTTGESLGLLIEEQRTNSFQRSEEFDNAYWAKVNASVTANAVIAPDGTLTADKLVEDATTNAHLIARTAGILPIGTSTLTVYAKAGERSRIALGNATSGDIAKFNLATGAVVSAGTGTISGGNITAVGNGWYRCACVVTLTGTASFGLWLLDNSDNVTYAGDGYKGAFVWGAQLEAGAFPTSYIPTTAASATRQADAASMTGTNFSSWYDAAEGTMYGEAIGFGAGSGGSTALMQVDDGTTNNRITIGMLNASTTGALVTVGGSSQVGISVSFTASYNKNVFAYKLNDFAQSLNGGTVQTDTSGLIPVVSVMRIASNATSANNVCIRKLAYYPLRLTNAQLQAITG